MDIAAYVDDMAGRARAAARVLADASTDAKNKALLATADIIGKEQEFLAEANAKDIAGAEGRGLSPAMIDRLKLDKKRVASMAQGLREVAALADPVGEIIAGWRRPNGLEITKVRVPLGVILMIYESRPNVTVDAAALTLKSGNAVILRGGSEAINSNLALHELLCRGLDAAGLQRDAVQMVETTDRVAVGELLKKKESIDVVIPRGGKGLIERVVTESTIPVIKHYEGVCHVYVDADADADKARKIVINAKCQRPGVCNAVETLLVHSSRCELLAELGKDLSARGVELRADAKSRSVLPDAVEATEEDWRTEYLAPILSIKLVDSVNEAIEHINTYGSGHSDAIVTEALAAAGKFSRQVDASAVFVNASTRFNDGGQFGLGAEIGISTDKLHARGPVGARELTSYKFIVLGDGHIRQ